MYDSKNKLISIRPRESRKSIETLPMSNGGRPPNIEDILNKTGNVTVTQFSFQNNQEIMLSGAKLLDEPGDVQRQQLDDANMQTSHEMNRFQKRSNSKRKKLGARSPYNQLYSTIKTESRESSRSPP